MSEEAAAAAEPAAAPAMEAPVAAPEAPASTSWLDSLNEEYRNNSLVNKFEDPNEFAKSYVNQFKVIGADKVVKPSKNWSDEQYEEFYAATGRPESAEEYQSSLFEQYSEEELAGLRQMAFEAGLQPRQFEKLSQFLMQAGDNAKNNYDEVLEQKAFEARESLRQEYGYAMDQKVDLAIRTAKQYLGADNMEIFETQLPDGTLLGDNPAVVKMFVSIAESMGEDRIVGETNEMVMTPQEAKRQIDEYMRPDSPYRIADHPDHDAAVAEVNRLFGFV
ncbi:MAG: hypothetical protein EBV86_07105 [Marivivens sp.]|nr:hypothetical protein [Marivivens sp.]NCW68327.1 hypothetical protein [Marivivens sp.]